MPCIIALETSGPIGGVAIVSMDGVCLTEAHLDEASRHGRGLMPAVETCLAEAGLTLQDARAVAVDQGPGSYTGLRVGVMAAKTLAYALSIPLVGVSSLDAIAWHERHRSPVLAVCTDARRDEVYFATYTCTAESATPCNIIRAISPDETLAALAQLPQGTPCVGSGHIRIEAERFTKEAPGILCVTEPIHPLPSAIGFLGAQLLRAQPEGLDPYAFQPTYPRREGVEMQVLGEGYQAPSSSCQHTKS